MRNATVVLAVAVLSAAGHFAVAQPVLVLDPYARVDWEQFGQYRANLHTHTTQSDGAMDPARVIDEYHSRGYHVLALTDHNLCTWPWEDYDRSAADLGMLAIPGNELSRHHHALSLFCEVEAPQRDLHAVLDSVAEAGGLAALCHPAMHWPALFRDVPALQVEMAPALRGITRGDFTLEAWFRTTDTGRNILMGNFSTDYAGSLNLELHTDNRVRVHVQPVGAGTTDLNASADDLDVNTRDGQWHHLAGVRRDGNVYVYLNGQLAGQRPDTAGQYDLAGDLYYIGRDTRTGNTIFNGDLDQVRLWTRGLTGEEVAALARGIRPGTRGGVSAAGMLAEYTFEQVFPGPPVTSGATVREAVPDTAGHPEGPFPAAPTPRGAPHYIDEVPEVLAAVEESPLPGPGRQAPAASRHAVRFVMGEVEPEVNPAVVEHYAAIFERHPHLVGIEVLNGTRPMREYPLDRELWDRLLTQFMPARPIWGFCVDDMHGMGHLGRDWKWFLAAELESDAIRDALVTGAYYFSSLRLVPADQRSVERTPRIQSIRHDAEAGTITINATVGDEPLPAEACVWISGGREVHTGLTLDYRNTEGIGVYARAELTGDGGVSFTNPFGFRRD